MGYPRNASWSRVREEKRMDLVKMFDISGLLSIGGMAAFLIVVLQIIKVYATSEESKRYIPLVGMVIGVGLMNLVLLIVNGGINGQELLSGSISGFLAGAAASGFYEAGTGSLSKSV